MDTRWPRCCSTLTSTGTRTTTTSLFCGWLNRCLISSSDPHMMKTC
ncbi:unnamed protein product [Leptidea sinapis]|uniref:Uncharacterized protein n=1 Tax=Leptidea sinapis TaxID=189913 RepID=A0A5E4QX00_9NEOP|nr:unnamed protein product [Leptidea sinapis]